MKGFYAFFILLLISSCRESDENDQNDPCDNINCNNRGTCINGVCQCDSGWAGAFCDSLVDPCDTVNCPGINSICIDGICYCQAGYEGDYCDILTYEKYIGVYNVSESCTTTFSGVVDSIYSTSIAAGSRIDVITINNFSNRGLPVDVNIIDATYLLIQDQDRGALQVSGGEGFYEYTNRIRFEYNYTVSSNFHSCTAIFTRF